MKRVKIEIFIHKEFREVKIVGRKKEIIRRTKNERRLGKERLSIG
jgi:hypothetical protein